MVLQKLITASDVLDLNEVQNNLCMIIFLH
jgi:hypothetical protein